MKSTNKQSYQYLSSACIHVKIAYRVASYRIVAENCTRPTAQVPVPAVSRVKLLTGTFTGESLHSGAGGAVRDRRADRVRHDGERRVDHRTQALP